MLSKDTLLLLSLSACFFYAPLVGFANTTSITITSSTAGSSVLYAQSLPDAIRRAMELRSQAVNADITVSLPAGDFRLADPIVLTGAISGKGPFTLKGADTGTTRLLGSTIIPPSQIQAATQADLEGAKSASLSVAKKIELPVGGGRPSALLLGDSKRGVNGSSYPFVQGRTRLSPARWPLKGWAVGNGPPSLSAAPSSSDLAVQLPQQTFDGVKSEKNILVSGFWAFDWFYEREPVLRADAAERTLVAGPVRQKYKVREQFRYAIENAYSALSPGRFVLKNGGESAVVEPLLGGKPLELITARTLLQINGASNVTISGMTFENSTGTSIQIVNSNSVTLKDIYVGNAGVDGIEADRVSNLLIQRAVIADAGANGIDIDAGDRPSLTPGNVQILDSVVTRAGALIPTAPAILIDGVGTSVSGCLIIDVPQMAIKLAGNDHLVEANEITSTNKETNDAGAIYMGRDWTDRGNVIKGNYFHDIGVNQMPNSLITAIYLDDGESGFSIEKNIFANVSRAIFIHGGRDNQIRGNAFLSSEKPAISIEAAAGQTSDEQWNKNGIMRKRMEAMPVSSELWTRRYPKLQDLLSPGRGIPAGNKLIGNVFFGDAPIEYRRKLDPSLMPLDQSHVYAAEATFGTPSPDSKTVVSALTKDPRLKELGLELANRQERLSGLRYFGLAGIGADVR